ncbi:hypothetical protein KMI_08g13340 [Encephalitozoon hellem]|nr:hypothetical protein KMI_08g13340 [Encephalitozoon hellem]
MELGLILMFMSTFVGAKDRELEEFVERDIKVFFSSYPAQVLGLEEESGILVSHSKYVNPSKYKFITRARLVKSGDKYIMIFGENNVCKDGNSVIKCKEERPWDIDRKEFGYTISSGNKCITKGPDETIEMKACVNTEDQIFNFKLADIGGCGSLESLAGNGSPKNTTTNVNIFHPDHEHLPSIKIKSRGNVSKNIILPTNGIESRDECSSYEEDMGGHVVEEVDRPLYEDVVPERRVVVKRLQKKRRYPRRRRTYIEHHHGPHHYGSRGFFGREPIVF